MKNREITFVLRLRNEARASMAGLGLDLQHIAKQLDKVSKTGPAPGRRAAKAIREDILALDELRKAYVRTNAAANAPVTPRRAPTAPAAVVNPVSNSTDTAPRAPRAPSAAQQANAAFQAEVNRLRLDQQGVRVQGERYRAEAARVRMSEAGVRAEVVGLQKAREIERTRGVTAVNNIRIQREGMAALGQAQRIRASETIANSRVAIAALQQQREIERTRGTTAVNNIRIQREGLAALGQAQRIKDAQAFSAARLLLQQQRGSEQVGTEAARRLRAETQAQLVAMRLVNQQANNTANAQANGYRIQRSATAAQREAVRLAQQQAALANSASMAQQRLSNAALAGQRSAIGLQRQQLALQMAQQRAAAYQARQQAQRSGGGAGGASIAAIGSGVKSTIAQVGSALGVAAVVKLADEYLLLKSRVALVTNSLAEQEAVFTKLTAVSMETYSSLKDTVGTYYSLARNNETLGLSQNEMVGIMKTLNQTILLSGQSAQAASYGLIQLGQAFGTGQLRGEELNSVLEQMPRLAQLIAKSVGVAPGALKTLAKDGKLTVKQVIDALKNGSAQIAAEAARIPVTAQRGLTNLKTGFEVLIGKFNEASKATQHLSTVFNKLGAWMMSDGAVNGLVRFADEFSGAMLFVGRTTMDAFRFIKQNFEWFRAAAIGLTAIMTGVFVAKGIGAMLTGLTTLAGGLRTAAVSFGVMQGAATAAGVASAAALGPIAVTLGVVGGAVALAGLALWVYRDQVRAALQQVRSFYEEHAAAIKASLAAIATYLVVVNSVAIWNGIISGAGLAALAVNALAGAFRNLAIAQALGVGVGKLGLMFRGIALAAGNALMTVRMFGGVMLGVLAQQGLWAALRGAVVAAFTGIVSGVSGLAAGVGGAIAAVTAPVWLIPALIAAAVAAIVGGLVWFANTSQTVNGKVVKGWDVLVGAARATGAWVKSIWASLSDFMQGMKLIPDTSGLGSMITLFRETVATAKNLANALVSGWGESEKAQTDATDRMKQDHTSWGESLQSTASGAINAVIGFYKKLGIDVTSTSGMIVLALRTVGWGWNALKAIWAAGSAFIAKVWDNAMKAIANSAVAFKTIMGGIGNAMAAVLRGDFAGAAAAVGSAFTSAVGQVGGSLNVLTGAVDAAGAASAQSWAQSKKDTQEYADKVVSNLGRVKEAVDRANNDAGNAFDDAITSGSHQRAAERMKKENRDLREQAQAAAKDAQRYILSGNMAAAEDSVSAAILAERQAQNRALDADSEALSARGTANEKAARKAADAARQEANGATIAAKEAMDAVRLAKAANAMGGPNLDYKPPVKPTPPTEDKKKDKGKTQAEKDADAWEALQRKINRAKYAMNEMKDAYALLEKMRTAKDADGKPILNKGEFEAYKKAIADAFGYSQTPLGEAEKSLRQQVGLLDIVNDKERQRVGDAEDVIRKMKEYDPFNLFNVNYEEAKQALEQLMARGDEKALENEILNTRKEALDTARADAQMRYMSAPQQQAEAEIQKHIAAYKALGLGYTEEEIRRQLELLGITRMVEEEARLKSEQKYNPVEGAKTALFDFVEDVRSLGTSINGVVTNALGGMTDMLVNFAMTGKASFTDMARSIIADILKIIAKALIMQAVLFAMDAIWPGSAAFLMGTARVGGAVGTGVGAAKAGAATTGAIQAGKGVTKVAHTGGIAGGHLGVTRTASAAMFENAKRFHVGGLAGHSSDLKSGEVPIIAKKNEAILPTVRLPDGNFGVRAIGGGGSPTMISFSPQIAVSVSVENNNQGGAGQSQPTDPDQARRMGGEVGRAVDKAMNDWAIKNQRPGGLLHGLAKR